MSPTKLPFSRPISRRTALALCAFGAVAAATPSWRGFAQEASPAAGATTELAPFLDATTVHDIAITFAQDDYDAMIQTYAASGEKEWITGEISIDGTTYEQVGFRLKGNSSLMGLGNSDGRGMAGVNADAPQSLPWLIKLNEYVAGQNHEGMKQMVIRSNTSETSLNEAVALNLLQEAGLASQQAAYVRFQANGSDATLRLAIEHPKTPWMEANFGEGGLLYKAESTGNYSYRGDDADDYVEVFDIEAGDTGDDQLDLTPLFGFLDFINNADDATFAAELGERLNVDGFATYLAMMNLVRNQDDIDGPGNNSYLYVGADGEYFTVVPWDMNLAFGGFGGMRGGGDGLTMPGNGIRTAPNQTERDNATIPGFPEDDPNAQGGATPPEGMPEGSELPDTGQVPGGFDGPGGQGGFGGMNNILVQRTSAMADFEALLTSTQSRLADQLYTDGVAETVLGRWITVLQNDAGDLVTASTISTEADSIRSLFTNP